VLHTLHIPLGLGSKHHLDETWRIHGTELDRKNAAERDGHGSKHNNASIS
jgi:hypothetical protein